MYFFFIFDYFFSLQDYTMDIYMRQIWYDDRMQFNEINTTIVLPAKAMENVSFLYNTL